MVAIISSMGRFLLPFLMIKQTPWLPLVLVHLVIIESGCLQRSGEIFNAVYPWTGNNYLFAAMETASGNGNLVCLLMDMPSQKFESLTTVETEISPRAVAAETTSHSSVYVANYTSGTVSVYLMNRWTCNLTLIQTVSGLPQASSVAIHYYGINLYVGYAAGVQLYSIASDGTLAALGPPVSASAAVESMAIDTSSKALYVKHSTNKILTMPIADDASISAGSNVTLSSVAEMDVGSALSGQRYLVVADTTGNAVMTYTIDSSTGALTLVDSTSVTAPVGVKYVGGLYFDALWVQMANGTLKTYTQNPDKTWSLFSTNSEVSDTMLPVSTTSNISGIFVSVGSNGGLNSWIYSVSSGISAKLRRQKSLAQYGTQINAIRGVIIQTL